VAPASRALLTEPLDEATRVAVFRKAAPSVVQVVSLGQAPLSFQTVAFGSGSGFVWDDRGHVVTNNHVIGPGTQAAVRLSDGRVERARVVGRAPQYDLAVLRLSGELPPPLAIGESASLNVGQDVLAIGAPFGLGQTLTTGIVSALDRTLPGEAGRELTSVIQTDAAINPGNSGGPLLDSAGRVIGVNTAIYSPSGVFAGVGFAVPIDTARRVVPELIRTGRATTPGIGIAAADPMLQARVGAPGVIVLQVRPGSPAAEAGLRAADLRTGRIGDVIVGAGERRVRGVPDLIDALEDAGAGATVTLQVLRDGRRVEVPVRVEAS
jgi:2-alkenal reductase